MVSQDELARPDARKTPPRQGRPRSERSRRAILEAALELTREAGYRALTTRAIAVRAGVGRQTLFRWWPSKAAIVLDALLEEARLRVRDPQTGTLEGDLSQFLIQTFQALSRSGDVLRVLMAEAQTDPAFATLFRERFISRRRDVLRGVLDRARQRGQIAAACDLDLLVDLAFGPMWYRLMNRHAHLNTSFALALAHSIAAVARTRGDRT